MSEEIETRGREGLSSFLERGAGYERALQENGVIAADLGIRARHQGDVFFSAATD